MNADAELDPPVHRNPRVARDRAVLKLDRASHRVDHAAEFSDEPVASALDYAAVVDGNDRVDEVAAQRAEPRKRAILVRAGEPAIADDIGDQDRSDLALAMF